MPISPFLCYTPPVNIILFEPHEMGKPLPRRDERTIHLLKVLRKKAGDSFDAGLLGGNVGTGFIEDIKFDGSIVYILDLKEAPPPRYPVRLAVGFPRPIQIRRILRDLSNLGLEAIDLIGTELGEKSYRDTKLLTDGGARAALIEGAVQARDTRIPLLSAYTSLDEWLGERPWDKPQSPEHTSDFSWNIYAAGLSKNRSPILIAADNVRPEGTLANLSALGQSMVLAVGSERGWSDAERDKLEAAGFLRLSMGDRALRTETACTAAAILALEKTGVLG
ncbi:RNA methyltransferase superfamily [Leadbettera azotonutricia ZAS-9]|uniref:Ribosomal RNA small subunit methyltransferase E n=1 Tax=Leadbettera azotonutricia (strain ATCC BAA-888 / DSM 13862 / ZAS-9) TaxID=545695 RepID=F5YD33_LEAAZ|nr:RNA methyltransferase superfamily [Leadbettera azotonutricia ZAS-9]